MLELIILESEAAAVGYICEPPSVSSSAATHIGIISGCNPTISGFTDGAPGCGDPKHVDAYVVIIY